jgi:hypothetical protein
MAKSKSCQDWNSDMVNGGGPTDYSSTRRMKRRIEKEVMK